MSKSYKKYLIIIAFPIICALFPGHVFGQALPLKILTKSAPQNENPVDETIAKKKPQGPFDEFDRGTPRTTVAGFLKATDAADYQRAVNYLDLRFIQKNMPEGVTGPILAKYLRIAMDQSFWVDLDLLSDTPKGEQEDELPAYRDRIGRINIQGKSIDVLLQKVSRKDGVQIWKFSNATVAEVPAIIIASGYAKRWLWLEENLPAWSLLGLFLWQWIAFLGMVLIVYGVLFILTRLAGLSFRKRNTEWDTKINIFICGPVRFLVLIFIARVFLFDLINPSVVAKSVFELNSLGIIVVIWFLIKVIDLIRDLIKAKFVQRGDAAKAPVLRPLGAVAKLIVVAVGLLAWLENYGFEITTLVAGLGVGSFALALAAQKSIEDMFGALSLYLTEPIRVGEFFRFGDKLGVVEEIGLRLTRIRTLENTVLNVPNSKLASSEIENFTRRNKIWYHPTLRLANTTTPEQTQAFLSEGLAVLKNHPKIEQGSARLRFVGFGEYSFNFEIFSYILTTDYAEFLLYAEELHIQLIAVVHKLGTSFAVPTERHFIENPRSLT